MDSCTLDLSFLLNPSTIFFIISFFVVKESIYSKMFFVSIPSNGMDYRCGLSLAGFGLILKYFPAFSNHIVCLWHHRTPLITFDKVEFLEEVEWEERVAVGQV